MCSPKCIQQARDTHLESRRNFLRGSLGLVLAGAAAGCSTTRNHLLGGETSARSINYSRVVDLTHPLSETFPTFGGDKHFTLKTLYTKEKDGYNLKKWDLIEHTGTHIDAPFHFNSGGATVDQLDPSSLLVPLVVVDITERVSKDPDTRLTVDDVKDWERRHGRLPVGACVAMNSNWSARVHSSQDFRNPDKKGVMCFPGVHVDVAEFLIKEREISGVAVDTLSLDHGSSEDFAFHSAWLSSGRWGIECMANLNALPERGAHVFVGAPKVSGGTGGLTRILALA
jgi:kynurenine formamidase